MPATLNDIQRKYGESVYPLYKDVMHEPYMEEDTGVGYKGVVLYDELESKIQCSDCGKWLFAITNSHLRTHKSNQEEYRRKCGLNRNVPLCSVGSSRLRSSNAAARKSWFMNEVQPKGIKAVATIAASRKGKPRPENTRENQTLQSLNKRGLCDAQIAAKLVVVRDMVGKELISQVDSGDVLRCDEHLYRVLNRRYGNTEMGCKALGIKYADNCRFEDSELIAGLRNFVLTNKKIPTSRDVKRVSLTQGLATSNTYFKHFGSWRRAKMMAGLDQLLEEVKGNEVGNIGDSGSSELSRATVGICDTN